MGKKLTTEEFIKKAKLVHNSYDYSLSEYTDSKNKINIICPAHGEFYQVPSKHLFGQGCPICSSNNKKSLNDLLIEFNKIHNGKYKYDLHGFKNMHDDVNIICPEHGEFNQSLYSHKNGNGCPICAINNRTSNVINFIEKAKEKHGNKYNYKLFSYVNNNEKSFIICPIHGEFEQSPRVHLSGCGCPICNESKGELYIKNYLKQKNIKFITQQKFINCIHKRQLPFDFYLPEHNTCIEFNGLQHYKAIKYFGGDDYFEKIKIRDEIKIKFCLDNNIKLIIIKYNQNIENVLDSKI